MEWRGKPVYIVRRTAESLAAINAMDTSILRDAESKEAAQPDYVAGSARTLEGKEKFLVLVGLCTHLGCAPMYRPDVGAQELGGDSWLGGFFCPCHGSKFDLSGRVYAGVPAPSNLEVPQADRQSIPAVAFLTLKPPALQDDNSLLPNLTYKPIPLAYAYASPNPTQRSRQNARPRS